MTKRRGIAGRVPRKLKVNAIDGRSVMYWMIRDGLEHEARPPMEWLCLFSRHFIDGEISHGEFLELANEMLARMKVATPPGTVTWRHPDERPTLRDDAGRTMAVVDAWRP